MGKIIKSKVLQILTNIITMKIDFLHHNLWNHNNLNLKDRITNFTTLMGVVGGSIRSLASILFIKIWIIQNGVTRPWNNSKFHFTKFLTNVGTTSLQSFPKTLSWNFLSSIKISLWSNFSKATALDQWPLSRTSSVGSSNNSYLLQKVKFLLKLTIPI